MIAREMIGDAVVKNEIAGPDDNPPIGILLCTEKSAAVVEYARAGIDQQLFVSRYLKALPSKDELSRFVSQERDSSKPAWNARGDQDPAHGRADRSHGV